MGKLWTFGCSMAWGQELHFPEEDRWSKQVADHLGLEDINLARSGASNRFIEREILVNLPKIDVLNDVVLVMWTDPMRQEHIVPGNHSRTLTVTSDVNAETGVSVQHNLAENLFYKHLYNEQLAMVHTAQIQHSIFQLLNLLGIQFKFMYWRDKHFNIDPFYLKAAKVVDFYNKTLLSLDVYEQYVQLKSTFMDSFIPLPYVEWAEYNKFSLGPRGAHPLNEANNEWAKIIIEQGFVNG